MPLDEREKRELAEKIAEQRKSVWKGEVSTKRDKKKGKEPNQIERTLDRQQGHEKIQETLEPRYSTGHKDFAEERKEIQQFPEQRREHESIKQTSGRRSDKPKSKRKSRNSRSSVPTLKLALLMIIGLIASIIMGVAIGYLIAVRDLIKI